ncbi:MBOAT-domain-containing protein [Gigaspora margarita]|uniref:MBOAT-domain-containing protein n=1 Tax=Gigaspora margarita TaxID=4874 RepID=A0A8H3X8U7_GIGMA|nr:MBOAT-domain-containing protein [Gigaspora margarita]
MFAPNNLREPSKDSDENSSTKYSVLETSSSPTSSKTKRPTKISPPLWNTWEFGFYYFIVTASVFLMFKVGYDLSKETHPNYEKYSWRLQDGWIFGRKVDNSDIQFASFRNHYGALIFALAVYLVLSHLYRFFLVPKSPAKFQSQLLIRTYFFLGFSIIFLYVMFGNNIIKILMILSTNYLIPKVFEGSIANPIITWIFNLGILFLNETYGNYKFGDLNENLSFLDNNRGLVARWDVTFNICMLRLVSFNMDYYWSFHSSNNTPEKNDRDLAPLTEKDRIIGPCFREDYNFIYYLSYILYAPLYLAGPIITYNNFIAQLRYPREIDLKTTLIYGLRLFIAIMIMEFMLHYTYVVAIVKSKAWDGDSPLELGMIGVLNLELVWLKLLIIWRFFRFWAMSDGIDTQENILRCMLNNYSTSGFWRSWHRSYYRWIIRYIYVPLGGNKHSTLNMLIVFIFVALWHDISLKLLAWGWLIWLFILPETISRKLFSSQEWADWSHYRHLCAVGAIINLLMMWAANLVGFVVGLDGMKVLFTSIFMTPTGLMELGIACIVLFCGAQILFEIREEEKRKGINSEIRY